MTTYNDLLTIADKNDILICDIRLKGCEAASVDDNGDRIIVVDSQQVKSDNDKLTKTAHELGHCMMYAFYDEHCPVVPRGRCERRATKWAVQNVVTKKDLLTALHEGYTEVWELSDYFGVTDEFMIDILKYYKMWNGD